MGRRYTASSGRRAYLSFRVHLRSPSPHSLPFPRGSGTSSAPLLLVAIAVVSPLRARMLLSPGHSPRHLSTPSPAPSEKTPALDSPSTPSSLSAASANPKKRRATVLDEDTYVEAIEKIIERDFFPDIPKLRDRLDWLEAVRTGDPVLIRDAQLKIMERRSKSKVSSSSSAPDLTATGGRNRTQTPASEFLDIPSVTPMGSDKTPSARPPGASLNGKDPTSDEGSVDETLSLDEFLRKYTSEDNESFSKIMEKVNRKRKEKFVHLLERDGEDPKNALEFDKKERITDGFGTSDQPVSSLEGWKYTAKNLLMYSSDHGEAPLTEAERSERLKAMTKEINRANTRFHGKSSNESASTKDDSNTTILYAPIPGTTPGGAAWPFPDREAEKLKRYDLEELRKTPNLFYVESTKKADNGYSFVKTPSPAPGIDASPFMTWGEIEGTPLRLDLDDNSIGAGGSSDGPHFRMPLPPSRDVKAHSLSREAARKLRERSKMYQKPPLPSPARGASASPSGRLFSPAAQKFMRKAIAKSSHNVDETLRASYRRTSPLTATPKARISSSRFAREASLTSRSPSAKKSLTPPW